MVMTTSALYSNPEPEVVVEQEAPVTQPTTPEEPYSARFSLEAIEDTEDGGANLFVKMDYDTLVAFAKIGLHKVIEDAAKKAIEEHGSH
jgi:hypothetical protein